MGENPPAKCVALDHPIMKDCLGGIDGPVGARAATNHVAHTM